MAQAAVLPVLFAVDRDPNSLEAMLSDLSGRFGKDFTVTGETSPEAALVALQEMAAAEEPVALLLVDDAASDFLARAHEVHPRAKRVLLIDRDYLSSWETEQQKPNFELFRIVAEDGDNRVLQLRDALTRFGMPFGIYATGSEAGRRLLDEAGLDAMLPVVIRYDGQVTIDPSLPDLARAIGVSVKNDVDSCEVAIVGAGPAGLTAAVYAASEGLGTVMLDRALSGGQAGTSPMIRNYPGFPNGINGGVLMARTCEQAWLMGAHIVFAQEAIALERRGEDRVVRLLDGTKLLARTGSVACRQVRPYGHSACSERQPREVNVELSGARDRLDSERSRPPPHGGRRRLGRRDARIPQAR